MGPVTILEGPSSSTTESSNTFSVNVWIITDDVESKEVIASWTPNGEKTLWKLCLYLPKRMIIILFPSA